MGYQEPDDEPLVDVDLLQISSRRLPTAVIVTASGEIDLATADRLAAVLQAELDNRPGVVVIDLTRVQFLGSSGLSVLAATDHAASTSGQVVRIVTGEQHPVVRPLAVSGLARHLRLFRDVNDAVTAI